MADGAGQGIGGMVGMWVVIELRKRAHHVGNLPFVCSTRAHHGLLDLHGRVFANLERALRKRHKRSAAGMRRGDGRTNVSAKVDALDSSGIGTIAFDNALEVAGDMLQAHRERTSSTGLDAAIGTAANLATSLLDNPPPRMGQTRVDTQDNQANLPSPQAQRKARPHALFTNVCSRITQQRPYLASKVEP